MKKWSISILVASFLVAMLAAANSWAIVPEINIQVEGGNYPVVRGTTNLPDGMTLSVTVAVPGQYGSYELVKVKNGAFATGRFSVNGVGPVPPGLATVEVRSALPQGEPEAVTNIIGKYGENITGPLAYSMPGLSGRMARITITVDIP